VALPALLTARQRPGVQKPLTEWIRLMTLNDPTIKKPEQPQLFPAGLAASGKKQVEDMISLQKEFSEYLQEVNQNWLAHMRSEAALATQFATKLTATRSIPERATLCQEWTNRRMELFTEDSKRFLAETQKLMESSLRALASGWPAAA
jgi:hypothetical protein